MQVIQFALLGTVPSRAPAFDSQIFRSDRGVCSSCGVDCMALLEGVRARKETNQRVSDIAAFICSFAPTVSDGIGDGTTALGWE